MTNEMKRQRRYIYISLFTSPLILLLTIVNFSIICYKYFVENSYAFSKPTTIVISDAVNNLYVACKKIPFYERNRFHWDVIIAYETNYWEIYERRNDPEIDKSHLRNLEIQRPFIEMFERENYPSKDQLLNMRWENTFQKGSLSGSRLEKVTD